MGIIKKLDKATINKIAAGEVIERPASVVKELLENSLDSGADNILIEVKDGGRQYIKVQDNGCGMSREDARISFLRHTTSKLKDLFKIDTLGFRGEALSSIAAVSNLRLSTSDGKESVMLELEGGELAKEEEVGMAKGTILEVSGLFFNTPARKNYLKSRDVELSHIIEIVSKYALGNKKVSFKLISDDREIMVSPKTKNLINKITTVYGKETAKNMIPIEYKDDFIELNGFLGKPYLAKIDKSMQSLFINGRYVKNDTVSKAVYDAYHTLLFLDRHPVFVFNIKIDFSEIDVNVHPTKNIIRIEKEDVLYKSVFNACRATFTKNSLIPDVNADNVTGVISRQKYLSPADKQTLLLELEQAYQQENEQYEKLVRERIQAEQAVDTGKRIGPVLIVGQLNRMYILAEGVNGLMIIDQHAAEERVNFERFIKQYKQKDVVKQKLLKPVVLEFPLKQFSLLQSNKQVLENLGFILEEYGERTFIFREVPEIFGAIDMQFITDIANELEVAQSMVEAEKEDKIARMACRASIKAGDSLTMPQMQRLIHELDQCEAPFSCPHGRPTIISLTLADLEKKFNRIG